MNNFNIDKFLEDFSLNAYLEKIYSIIENEGVRDFIYFLKNRGIVTLLEDWEEDNIVELFEQILSFLENGESTIFDHEEWGYGSIYKWLVVYEYNFKIKTFTSWQEEDDECRDANNFFKDYECEGLCVKIDSFAIYAKYSNRYFRFPFKDEKKFRSGMTLNEIKEMGRFESFDYENGAYL